MKRRVVVTGLGVISSVGHNVPTFWREISHGRPGIGPMELVDRTQLRCPNAAEVRGFRATDHFEEKQAGLIDRFCQFSLVAAREAAHDAGFTPSGPRCGVVTGSCVGGQTSMDEAFLDLYQKGLPRVNPMMIPRVMSNSGASHISMDFGITGPVYSISTACSSSNHAIGQAFWMVRDGVMDAAIAGGGEAVFSMGFLKAWEAMRVVSPDTCRPFSKDRQGLILGEGAAMAVLETMEAASARGARIYGEIAGFGMSSDAHHITQPSADGAALAMRMALRDAVIAPEAVGYINAHGTGTASNDSTETAAIRSAFGTHAGRLAVSSTKSMHGHALGAAGALEAAATLLALHHGIIPPTANYNEPDPACDLDVVPNTARPLQCEYALSNSFAFGGLNAVLAFRASAGVC